MDEATYTLFLRRVHRLISLEQMNAPSLMLKLELALIAESCEALAFQLD